MKITAIRKKRTVLATAGLLMAVLAAAGLSLAWTGHHHYRMGGGWIGAGGGMVWSCVQVPLDSEGEKAALQIHTVSYGADMAGLLAAFGADSLSDTVGEAAMISGDTGKWTAVCYGVKQGNPTELRLINIMTGTATFTGVDRYNIKFTMAVYPAAADANGDGFPDPGATPLVIPNQTASVKRVPLP